MVEAGRRVTAQAQSPNVVAGRGRSASSKSKCDRWTAGSWEAKMQGLFRDFFNCFCLRGLGGSRNFAGQVQLLTAKTAPRKDVIP